MRIEDEIRKQAILAAMNRGAVKPQQLAIKRGNQKAGGCNSCGKKGVALQQQKNLAILDTLPRDTTARLVIHNQRPAGVGDAITGLCAVAGLRDKYPNADITYVVRTDKLPWVNLFSGFTATDKVPDNHRFICYPNFSYDQELKEKANRTELYARYCGCSPALPVLRELPGDAVQWAEQYRDATIIAPHVHWTSRAWNPAVWRCFIAEAKDAELRVVAMAGNEGELAHYQCEKVIGESPPRVAALLQAGKCLVGMDSGPAWLAGAVGARAIILCGPTDGRKLFGLFPSVEVVQGGLRCSACYWQPQAGYYGKTCDSPYGCSALHQINPQDIVKKVLGRTLAVLN